MKFFARGKFEIGQIDVDIGIDQGERLRCDIPARVEDDGNVQIAEGERLGDRGDDMIGGDEVDVLGALRLEGDKELAELLRGHFFTLFGTGDFKILTKDTAEGTAAEEDRPAPAVRREEGLFEGM